MSDNKGKRWFSTGFMGGVGLAATAVDADKHVLTDAVVIQPGEAKGHGLWIDRDFCASVVGAAGVGKFATAGVKARFGHPNMCSDAMGTFLGRWKNLRNREDGAVIGDLYLSSTAAESPRGDLRKYVEEMAAKEPEHFGASIVFSRDTEAETAFEEAHRDEATGFKSPDPANGANLPHARLAELHAADLVDDPAATDGMFSRLSGAALAAQVTEWLDLHPEILKALADDPAMTEILARYPTEINAFLKRYAANQPPAASPPDVTPPAEPDGNATALAESKAAVATLAGQLAGKDAEIEAARKQAEEALKAQADEAAAKATEAATETEKLRAELIQAKGERDAALARIAALERGTTPLSSGSAPRDGELSPWRKAQLAARNKTK